MNLYFFIKPIIVSPSKIVASSNFDDPMEKKIKGSGIVKTDI